MTLPQDPIMKTRGGHVIFSKIKEYNHRLEIDLKYTRICTCVKSIV